MGRGGVGGECSGWGWSVVGCCCQSVLLFLMLLQLIKKNKQKTIIQMNLGNKKILFYVVGLVVAIVLATIMFRILRVEEAFSGDSIGGTSTGASTSSNQVMTIDSIPLPSTKPLINLMFLVNDFAYALRKNYNYLLLCKNNNPDIMNIQFELSSTDANILHFGNILFPIYEMICTPLKSNFNDKKTLDQINSLICYFTYCDSLANYDYKSFYQGFMDKPKTVYFVFDDSGNNIIYNQALSQSSSSSSSSITSSSHSPPSNIDSFKTFFKNVIQKHIYATNAYLKVMFVYPTNSLDTGDIVFDINGFDKAHCIFKTLSFINYLIPLTNKFIIPNVPKGTKDIYYSVDLVPFTFNNYNNDDDASKVGVYNSSSSSSVIKVEPFTNFNLPGKI